MSRLAKLGSNPLIREYAQAVALRTITPVGNFLAPSVSVQAAVGRYKQYTEKNRFRLPDTIRPAGARAVRVMFDATDATYNCTPHAIDIPYDVQEISEADNAGENVMMEAADIAAEMGTLAHERDVINAALASLGAGTDVNIATTDPVKSIDQTLDAIGLAAAGGSLMGGRLLFGPGAWTLFKNSSYVRSRFVTSGSKAIPNVTVTEASGLFTGNPEIMVARAATDTTAEGQTASMAYLLNNSIIVFMASSNPTRRDPSFMKTFRLAGAWMGPGTYTSEDGRSEVAKYDWSHDVKVTNTTAATRLNLTEVAP